MITQWLDFAVTTAGGACAFIFLFEGTRRLRRYGIHRATIAMTVVGALFCLAYGGFSYWKHVALKDMAQVVEKKMFAEELPADWGMHLDPEKRERSSLAMARMAFVESGKLRGYFDRSGEKKRYTPTEEDIKSREFSVVTQARLEDAVRTNFWDALVWLIWGIVAVGFGLVVARDRAPLPANTTVETNARKSGARGSP